MTTICHSSTVQVFTRANAIKQEHPQVDAGVTDGKHCACAPPELRSLKMYQRSLVRISNNSGWLSLGMSPVHLVCSLSLGASVFGHGLGALGHGVFG